MSPGTLYRWETHDRFYQAWLGQDLLGDWTVLQQWGSKYTSLGSQLVAYVKTEAEGLQRLVAVARQREQHGYLLRELLNAQTKAPDPR